MVKTKSQKVLGANYLRLNSYVRRSYRGKTGRGELFAPPILNWVKENWDFSDLTFMRIART